MYNYIYTKCIIMFIEYVKKYQCKEVKNGLHLQNFGKKAGKYG